MTDPVGNILSEPVCTGTLLCSNGGNVLTVTNGGEDSGVRAKRTVTVRGDTLM